LGRILLCRAAEGTENSEFLNTEITEITEEESFSDAVGPRLRARVETSLGSQVPRRFYKALVIPGSSRPVSRP